MYMLKDQFKYYLDNQKELVKKYDGKVLVIKDCKVVGVFDNKIDALYDAKSKYAMGSFLIQKCSIGDEDYTAIYNSRVSFV